jgi:hypothetical protein
MVLWLEKTGKAYQAFRISAFLKTVEKSSDILTSTKNIQRSYRNVELSKRPISVISPI